MAADDWTEVSRVPLPGVVICPIEQGCYACLRYRIVETGPGGQSRERFMDGEPLYSYNAGNYLAKSSGKKAIEKIVLGADFAFRLSAILAGELRGAIVARDRLTPRRRA